MGADIRAAAAGCAAGLHAWIWAADAVHSARSCGAAYATCAHANAHSVVGVSCTEWHVTGASTGTGTGASTGAGTSPRARPVPLQRIPQCAAGDRAKLSHIPALRAIRPRTFNSFEFRPVVSRRLRRLADGKIPQSGYA